MTIEWLKEFCLAAQFANITKAAEYSYTSQSSLSRHIAELEKELNTRLIDRDNRSFTLTAAGEFFYKEIRSILGALDDTKLKTQQIGLGQTGELRIASFCSYIPHIFNKIYSFRQKHPEILCSINYVANVIPNALQPGSANLGIVFSFEVPPGSDLETKPLGRDDLCLVVPNDHPLAASNSVVLSSIHNQNIILLSSLRYPFMQDIMDKVMHGISGNVQTNNTTTEVENIETMILHVRFGEGVALLPRILAQERAGGCVILGINDLDVSFNICMCWKRSSIDPALALFLKYYDAD